VLEEFKARIALLLDEMAERPEDAHEVQERLREQLAELKALGMPLPEDLVALERSLSEDFEAEEEDQVFGRPPDETS
jgi:signal transduction protein with GAF and PtsI domain